MAVRSASTSTRTEDKPTETDEEKAPTQPKDPETMTSETAVGAYAPEETNADPGTLEVPWTSDDITILAMGLQRCGPFFMGNDVRSVESAKGAAVSILETFAAMNFEQPQPTTEFYKEQLERGNFGDPLLDEHKEVMADVERQQRAGNHRLPFNFPEHYPTPTEKVANLRQRMDQTDEQGPADENSVPVAPRSTSSPENKVSTEKPEDKSSEGPDESDKTVPPTPTSARTPSSTPGSPEGSSETGEKRTSGTTTSSTSSSPSSTSSPTQSSSGDPTPSTGPTSK
jgi:hypothetical protein